MGLERMTIHPELPEIGMLFEMECNVFINIAGYDPEDPGPPREDRPPIRSVVPSGGELGYSQCFPNPLFNVYWRFTGRHLIGENEFLAGFVSGQFGEP